MATSRIRFTFNEDMAIGQSIKFRRKYNDGNLIGDWTTCIESWVNNRLGQNQVSLGIPTAIEGERSAINFVTALGLDYQFASPGNGPLSRNGNVVTLFQSIYWLFDLDFPDVEGVNPDFVDIEILNYAGPMGGIENLSFLTATTNPACTHYKVSATTSELATSYSINGSLVSENTDNPITFELLRGQGFNLILNFEDDQSINIIRPSFNVPQILNSNNFTINIANSPNGGTATISNNTYSPINIYEFSLDGDDWQSSNVFPGLDSGDYSLYVRDQFGCSFTISFNINDGNIVVPHIYISQSNSIRYAERVTYGNCGPYKTDDNTLSCEAFAEDPDLAKKEIQQFQTCDSPPTQFQSNYENITAKVIGENGDETALSITQFTQNIGRKDSRDAIKYNLGNGKTGIYFMSGNLYDYDTGIDTGEDYLLNGGLPEFARIGRYISISGVWFLIENIIYDETLEVEALVISSIYTGTPTNVIVKSTFNRQDYEVYEFAVLFAIFNNQNIQVSILFEDSRFPTRQWISEVLNVKSRQEGTVVIKYWNESNTDMYYATGIRNVIRLPIRSIKGDHQDESELLITDNGSTLQSSEVYELDLFEFLPVTKGIYRQAVQALSHKYVEIDGISYAKNGNIEKEGPLEESNLYIIRAKMMKTNAPSTSGITSNNQDLILPNENLEVPNLVITDNGEFISY